MTDTTVIQEEAAPTQLPVSPEPADDIDRLLAEYDASVKPEPEPTALEPGAGHAGIDQPTAPEQTLDDLLRSSQDAQRIEQLSGQNAQLLEQINNERLRQATTDLMGKLQGDFPHVPSRSIEDKLEAAAARNPEVAFCWKNQFADKASANRELLQIEAHLQLNRSLDQQTRQGLGRRGYELGLILNADKIIAREVSRITKELGAEPEIDWAATYDRNIVAASVRDGGSGGKISPARPPDFGKMTDAEFREYKKSIGLPE